MGTWLLVRADTEEKVWQILRADAFYSSREAVSVVHASLCLHMNIADTVSEQWDHARITVTSAYLGVPKND